MKLRTSIALYIVLSSVPAYAQTSLTDDPRVTDYAKDMQTVDELRAQIDETRKRLHLPPEQWPSIGPSVEEFRRMVVQSDQQKQGSQPR